MKKGLLKIVLPVTMAAGLLIGGGAILASQENDHESYFIEGSSLYETVNAVFSPEDDNLVLVTSKPGAIRVSAANTADRSLRQLPEITGSCLAAAQNERDICLAVGFSVLGDDGIATDAVKVIAYDRHELTAQPRDVTILNLSSVSEYGFAAGKDGALYFLKPGDRYQIYGSEFRLGLYSDKMIEIKPLFSSALPIQSLSASPGGETIYAVLEDGSVCLLSEGGLIGLEGARVTGGFQPLGAGMAYDGAGNVYRLSAELGYVEELYPSMSAGPLCLYQGSVLAPFDSNLLLLDEKGNPIGQSSLEKRGPAYLFAKGNTAVCVTISSGGVWVELTGGLREPQEAVHYTTEDNTFAPNPLPGGHPLPEEAGHWELYLNPAYLSAARGEPEVVIKNEQSGRETVRNFENGLAVGEDGSLSFDGPNPVEECDYAVTVRGLCTPEGLPAGCSFGISYFTEPSGSSNPPVTPDSSSVPEDKKELLQSAVYVIDPSTRVMTGVEPGATLAQIRASLRYDGDLVVKNAEGTKISSGAVGTGTQLILMKDGLKLDEVTLLVYGDVNGDGSVNEKDVRQVVSHELYHEKRDVLKGLFLEAADYDRDGEYTFRDLDGLYKYIHGFGSLSQRPDGK